MVNLPIEYSDKPVTPFGGMSLLKRLLDQTKIREYLSSINLPSLGSNRGYAPEDIILSFWLGIWTGASRYIHCDWVRHDSVLQDIFGMTNMPSQSTYSRFFNKFNQTINTEVFPGIQHWFMEKLEDSNFTVDFDSTVITRYGEQEGSAVGYNPNKKGRNSHPTLMAFISQTRMVANAWLTLGNTAACSNCVEFMRETFERCLASNQVTLVRRSGFYTEGVLNYLEEAEKIM